jgi:hypothetical protein
VTFAPGNSFEMSREPAMVAFFQFLQSLSASGQVIFNLPRKPFPPSTLTFSLWGETPKRLTPTYPLDFYSDIIFWLFRPD